MIDTEPEPGAWRRAINHGGLSQTTNLPELRCPPAQADASAVGASSAVHDRGNV